jgi:hypothetical protein
MTWKRRGGFWGTLACLVGLHDWGDPRTIYTPFCTRCGKRDRPRSHQIGNVVHGDMAGGDIVKNEQEPNPSHHAEPRFGGDSVDGVVQIPNKEK